MRIFGAFIIKKEARFYLVSFYYPIRPLFRIPKWRGLIHVISKCVGFPYASIVFTSLHFTNVRYLNEVVKYRLKELSVLNGVVQNFKGHVR